MNNFWNPQDKRLTRRQILTEYCYNAIEKQREKEKIFRSKTDELLIRDKFNNLKKVTKIYYLYHMEDDEYETETELLNELDEIEKDRIINKYKN